jgi:hypothetical protein
VIDLRSLDDGGSGENRDTHENEPAQNARPAHWRHGSLLDSFEPCGGTRYLNEVRLGSQGTG